MDLTWLAVSCCVNTVATATCYFEIAFDEVGHLRSGRIFWGCSIRLATGDVCLFTLAQSLLLSCAKPRPLTSVCIQRGALRAGLRLSKRNLRHTAVPTNKITSANPDRRTRLRFPLDADLRYQVSLQGKISGTGQVVNISSKALAFRTGGPLQPGMRLRVSVAWPAKLNECKLRLAFEGVVLRARDGLVVATVERPQFRTSREGGGSYA